MTFEAFNLSENILTAIKKAGYKTPTPIQKRAIPEILKGSDVMGAAQTGTGKTAAFTLPLLQNIHAQSRAKSNRVLALILTPTRELAAQIKESFDTYGRHLRLRTTVVYGGVSINPQMMHLRRGADVLIATPGRLLDLYQQNAVKFNDLKVLVLDEADRMLDMGFIHDIKKIIALLPKQRQNLLFSATFSDEIRTLAKKITHHPVEIDVSPRNSTVQSIKQLVHPVDKARKTELLIHLIKQKNWYQALVFCRTKHGADRLVRQLQRRMIDAAAIHGDKSQGQRTRALAAFKANKVQVLVATDIAARGIDIEQLSHVVNYDLPNVAEDYVHRIGRTGRAGASGLAVSLVSADEAKQLIDIERFTKNKIKRSEIEGFTPNHIVPTTLKGKAERAGQATKHKQNNKPNRHKKNGQPQTKKNRTSRNRPTNEKHRSK